VLQFETSRAQGLTAKTPQNIRQHFVATPRQSQATTVDLIADQRMPTVRHVHTNLVGSAGFEFHIDMGMRGKAFFDPVMGNGRFAIGLHAHAYPIHRVALDGRVDRTPCRQHAVANGFVVTVDFAISQHAGQCGVRR